MGHDRRLTVPAIEDKVCVGGVCTSLEPDLPTGALVFGNGEGGLDGFQGGSAGVDDLFLVAA